MITAFYGHRERAQPDAARPQTWFAEGASASALVEAAKDADMVVVGSRGGGDFVDLLLGSVGQQVVHHANCPVVVVR